MNSKMPGPYDPCPCGSGKKYRFCHGAKPAGGARPGPAEVRGGIAPQHAQLIQQGMAAQVAGRLVEAEECYRRVLASAPGNVDALHLLGTIAFQTRQLPQAIELIQRAIAINPGVAAFHANLGHALKDAGRPAEAAASYEQALRLSPDFVEVLNNLALLRQAERKPEQAAVLFARAIAADPGYVFSHINLGTLRQAQGRMDEAEASYRKVLSLQPNFAEAHNNLGTVLQARGLLEEARRCYEHAAALKPSYGDALNNLGTVYEAQGDTESAARTFVSVIELGGNFDDARINLGALLQRQGHNSQAIEQFETVLARNPLHPKAHLNLGVALQREGRVSDALAHYLIAAALKLVTPELPSNIGTALQSMGRLERSLATLRAGIQIAGDSAEIHSNIGSDLYTQRRFGEAMAEFREALQRDPENMDANWNISLTRLATGQFAEMWDSYEWRIVREKIKFHRPWRPFSHKVWDGAPLHGKRLLIFPEQGIGDEIWFAGMFPEVIAGPARDGRVVIECRNKLLPLFRRSFPGAELVGLKDPPDKRCVEDVDCQIAGGSLGRYVRTSLASFPRREESGGAFLFADAGREAYWKRRLGELTGDGKPRLKVGVTWRSSNTKGERALVCTKLTQWGEIFRVPGIQFVNVQYDECEAELQEAEALFGVRIHRYPEVDMFDDLDETAALMRGLDLVIGPPTSVTIMSAALGVETWQTSYGVEWQCHGLQNSPWYPAMTNYEREWDQSWEEVLAAIAVQLARRAGTEAQYRPTVPHVDASGPTARFAVALRQIHDGEVGAARTQLAPATSNAAYPAYAALLSALDAAEPDLAAEFALTAARTADTLAEFSYDLGNMFRIVGRADEAVALLDSARSLMVFDANAWEALGLAAQLCRDRARTVDAFQRALNYDPKSTRLRDLLARALDELGLEQTEADRYAEAIATLTRARALAPDSASIHYRLGFALQAAERFDEAIEAYRRSLELEPKFLPAQNNLGNALRSCGRLPEAIDCYRATLQGDPELDGVRSNLLLTLNYAEGVDPAAFLHEHLEFGRRVSAREAVRAGAHGPHANRPDPRRPLRIGYVSADFRAHAVARFFEPMLAARNRGAFAAVCYANSARSDEVTARLQGLADGWRSLAGVDDETAHGMIAGDAIDILVDLSGHSAMNRLPLFARRPAPVQVSYLGYPATTGLVAIDYKIVDLVTAPADAGLEALNTEKLWRLAGPMWSYAPEASMPQVSALPAAAAGAITLASFNTVVKIGPSLIRTWAEILSRVPGARLMLATVPEGETRQRLGAQFAECGIDPARIEFHGRLPAAEFLKLYARADMALDAFPCNGGTTTFETLWMGVPVIALAGQAGTQLVSRVSGGILRGAGLDELLAQDAGDYVRKAVALANDIGRLAALRESLRGKMAASPYLDHAAFARSLEQAFREMWTIWCNKNTGAVA